MVKLIQGDCLEVLWGMEANSIDSLVTDTPAGISFMGKDWDGDKGGRDQWIAWMTYVMKECLRVLKPGAHGLVWALPRTSHWTATALENAGFDVRDVVTHLFGTGFPKSLDISKAIDKAAGAEREVIGRDPSAYRANAVRNNTNNTHNAGFKPEGSGLITAPSTDAAKQWAGFGTALKPACEMWVLVRKPLGEKTVAANVLKHGTGAINIDGCRIATDELTPRHNHGGRTDTNVGEFGVNGTDFVAVPSPLGRFPANLVLSHNPDCVEVGTKEETRRSPLKADGTRSSQRSLAYGMAADSKCEVGTETVPAWECSEGCAVAELDGQSGVAVPKPSRTGKRGGTNPAHMSREKGDNQHQDSEGFWPADPGGGASRFFYCAKASKRDKGEGNSHPTVKSSTLMAYLIRLVTPPGGTVLDPFMGSGSTGVAAIAENFDFIGIEKEAEYFKIAGRRIG